MLADGALHDPIVAACEVRYVPRWFDRRPGFASTGENFNIGMLWEMGVTR